MEAIHGTRDPGHWSNQYVANLTQKEHWDFYANGADGWDMHGEEAFYNGWDHAVAFIRMHINAPDHPFSDAEMLARIREMIGTEDILLTPNGYRT